ncbi:MAG: 3-phosphoserine/phosphohydroxythreonine transaminase [Candidatus Cloacimonetes bacterium]|nr:3-phosphoserine/phosphohydroxythreonine transaminase [Candidatus Cloacimonadota bacterium]
MTNRVHNFNAGPAVLPLEVLKEVQAELLDYKEEGLSVMEMSHRSSTFSQIINDAKAMVKKLMKVGDEYEVLFLQGGASSQFYMIPLNLCTEGKVANYLNTGAWSTKAIKEAKKIGKEVHVASSSEDKEFTYIPKTFKLSENPAYLHYTSNNTIRGTEFHFIPEVPEDVPLICDMSSNFFSRPMDFSKFDLIYGGAQKNIGPAGATLVVIKRTLLEKMNTGLPTMMDYNSHVAQESLYNTPPCFSIYVIGKVLHWLDENGGLTAIERHNIEKAAYVYDVIDSSDFYIGTVVPEDRSRMNIPFRLPSPELEKKFIAEAAAVGMIGLKGHKSVGGCRASVYNSLPMESAKALAEFMRDFEKNNS